MNAYRLTEKECTDADADCFSNLISSIRYASPLHSHEYYEFFLIASGRCMHSVNGGVQRLAEGALVFIRPDDTHAYDYDGESDCSFINIACTRRAVEGAFAYIGGQEYAKRLLAPGMPPVTVLSQAERERFAAAYRELRFAYTLDKPYARLLVHGLIVQLLMWYFRGGSAGAANRMPEWLGSLLASMQDKENFVPGLNRMYEIAPRSPGHLCRAFQTYLHTTPTAYVNSLRLGYARNLLLTTDLGILETAYESGFDNLSHFYHCFKKEFNITPAEMRGLRSNDPAPSCMNAQNERARFGGGRT